MKISYDAYDAAEERLLKIPYKADGWWPTIEDLREKCKPRCKTDYEFLMWLLLTNPAPETPEEKESKKMINNILYTKLEFMED